MYKDKDKQREAQRDWVRQKRAAKGSTKQGSTSSSPSGKTNTSSKPNPDFAKPKRGKDIKCFGDLPMDVQATIDRMSIVDGKIDQTVKANRTAIAINYQHLFPDGYHTVGAAIGSPTVTGKPGDADYSGVCTKEWRAERGR